MNLAGKWSREFIRNKFGGPQNSVGLAGGAIKHFQAPQYNNV